MTHMTPHKSKKKWIVCGVLAAVLACAGIWYVQVSAKEEGPPPVQDRTYTVRKGDITVGVEAQGKLKASPKGYFVAEGVAVEKLPVKVGQQVKKGDTLAQLSVSQSQKNQEKREEEAKAVKEELEKLQEDRGDYLNSLNWLLENQKNDSANAYEEKYWALVNEIDNLSWRIDEAAWKLEWTEEPELSQLSLDKLNQEKATKEAALEKLGADREQEKALEEDGTYQKEQQEKKLKEYDDKIAAVTAQLAAAQEKVEQAKSRVLVAEQDGVVLKINGKEGEATPANQPVVEVGDHKEMTLLLVVEPDSITEVEPGQQVEFYVDAYPEQVFSGEVTGVNLVPNGEGKYEVTVSVTPGEANLLDSMNAGATIVLKQKKDVLILENKAILLENGKQLVKQRDSQGEIVTKEIEAGFSDGRISEILSGLEEGEAVLYEE